VGGGLQSKGSENLYRVCWVFDLTEEHWILSEAGAPLLYTMLGFRPQPWSGLFLRSRHTKFKSVVALPVIIFLDFLIFQILNIFIHFCEIYFTLNCFPDFRGSLIDHRQHFPL
jgi:hypothetical protein